MDLSLFYFADDAQLDSTDRYRILLDGARFADTHGFTAVWTPERHFARFGGNYPNPAVTGAAVAAVTEHIDVRAGSVVAPLHNVTQIAEDWAAVDALSGGRAGISLASGWSERDFVLQPDQYAERHRTVMANIDTLRGLWHEPRRMLPMWLSSAGSPDTFRAAGRAGVGVLTHLARQEVSDLADRIADYRQEFAASGSPGRAHVVLMLHTYLGVDMTTVEASVRVPLQNYLISALKAFEPRQGGATAWRSRERMRIAIRPAYERYLRHGRGLFGSVDQAEKLVCVLRTAGVDEIACLIDFGVPSDLVMQSLLYLDELRVRITCQPS